MACQPRRWARWRQPVEFMILFLLIFLIVKNGRLSSLSLSESLFPELIRGHHNLHVPPPHTSLQSVSLHYELQHMAQFRGEGEFQFLPFSDQSHRVPGPPRFDVQLRGIPVGIDNAHSNTMNGRLELGQNAGSSGTYILGGRRQPLDFPGSHRGLRPRRFFTKWRHPCGFGR